MIEPGDTVEWTSQANGSAKTKRGKVIKIIVPNIDATMFLPFGLPKSRFKGERFSRNHRALVEVPRKSGNGSDYYAPRIEWLKKVDV